jgi:putative CocE/NonD family hydrolase
VPTIGGALTSGEPIMHGGMFDQRVTPDIFTVEQGPSLLRLAERPDVLVFEGDTLAADLAIVGAVEVDLFVSSDCPDTDFTVKLVDLHPPTPDYPEGYAMNITDGILRMRYRDGWDREVMMEPDVVYPITVRMLATANLFKVGHRLRIDISSSNFPQFDINPNTGEPEGDWHETRVAKNRVSMGGLYPSQVRFPVLDLDAREALRQGSK